MPQKFRYEGTPKSTTADQLQSFMPPLSHPSLRLGYDQRIPMDERIGPTPDPDERQSQILEDHLHVQLLLPKILQEFPQIEGVQLEPPAPSDMQHTESSGSTESNLFVVSPEKNDCA